MAGRQKGLHFYNKRKKLNSSTIKEIWSWIFWVVVSVFLAFVATFAFGSKTSVIGVSMEPNLYNGQEILINRFQYEIVPPKRGDVIVFLPNGNVNSHYYVKRVVGLPGESIQIKEGKIFIDGVMLENGFNYDKIADGGNAKNEVLLGTGEYFVLGDNVNSSEDSRSASLGTIRRDTILGKAWFRMASGDSGMGFVE